MVNTTSTATTGTDWSNAPRPAVPRVARVFDTVVIGGFTAGTLDILDAIALTAMRGGSPPRMLQGIASGLLGPRAFEGGTATVILGLLLHFTIALGAAGVYYLASRRLPVLRQRWILCGLAFGLCVWAFMQFVVLPLSLVRQGPWPAWPFLLNQWLIHALGVGLPIAAGAAGKYRSSADPADDAV